MGTAAFKLTVAPDGTVISVSTVHAHPVFTAGAVAALKQWRLQPSDHESQFVVTISFEFYDEPCEKPLVSETRVSADLPSKVVIQTGLQCIIVSNSGTKQ